MNIFAKMGRSSVKRAAEEMLKMDDLAMETTGYSIWPEHERWKALWVLESSMEDLSTWRNILAGLIALPMIPFAMAINLLFVWYGRRTGEGS